MEFSRKMYLQTLNPTTLIANTSQHIGKITKNNKHKLTIAYELGND